MKEFDLLGGYPEPKKPRYVNQNLRTIKKSIIGETKFQALYHEDYIFWREIIENNKQIKYDYFNSILFRKFIKEIIAVYSQEG